jgi:hypothetical protein
MRVVLDPDARVLRAVLHAPEEERRRECELPARATLPAALPPVTASTFPPFPAFMMHALPMRPSGAVEAAAAATAVAEPRDL